jgi:hypothetical protein
VGHVAGVEELARMAAGEQRRRHVKAESPCGLGIDGCRRVTKQRDAVAASPLAGARRGPADELSGSGGRAGGRYQRETSLEMRQRFIVGPDDE